jgi:hypothetical protein
MTEYRNGNIIGTSMRDVQLYTVQCTNQAPTITGMNGTTATTMYVLPEQPFCFSIFCYDTDTTDTLTMYTNNGIPAGVFSLQSDLRPTGVFCWTPTLADVSTQPHVFTAIVVDNNCPAQGSAAMYFTIYVTTDSTLVSPYTQGTFSGLIYYDANSNGIKDSAEIYVPSQSISVQPDNITMLSNYMGEFLFNVSNGSHVISLNPSFGWLVTSDSSTYTVTNNSTNQTGFDFGVNSLNPENDLSVSIAPGFPRCNSTSVYHLNYENTGSTLLSGRIIFIVDNAVTYVTGYPLPDQTSGDSLFYNFTNLWPFQTNSINLFLLIPGTAGDTIYFEAIAQYDSSGNFVSSDSQTLSQIVTCSMDPNDKLVLPEGLYSDHRTLYNDELQYTVRFQNTGTILRFWFSFTTSSILL